MSSSVLKPLESMHFSSTGDESIEEISFWKEKKIAIIKAIRIEKSFSRKEVEMCSEVSDYLLFDAKTEGDYGGSGCRVSSSILDSLNKAGFLENAFVAGGLRADNVLSIVKNYSPFAVDVASGVESAPGIKEEELVSRFISQSKEKKV